jgi:hypothetical protein
MVPVTLDLILISTGVGILAALLVVPVSLRFNSSEKQLIVRWLGFSIRKKYVTAKPGKPGKKISWKGWLFRTLGQLVLEDRTLACDMVSRLFRPFVSMIRSVSLRDIEATFSVPDPMWNGLLHGVLANMSTKNVHLSMNFENVTSIRGSIRFYPYRVLMEVLRLLPRLPYRRIIRAALSRKKLS